MDKEELKRYAVDVIAEASKDVSLNPSEGSKLYKGFEKEIGNYSEQRRALDIINAEMPDGYAFVIDKYPDSICKQNRTATKNGCVILVRYNDDTGNRRPTPSNHDAPERIPEEVMELLDKAGFNDKDSASGKIFYSKRKAVHDGVERDAEILNITIDNPDEIARRLRGNPKHKEMTHTYKEDFMCEARINDMLRSLAGWMKARDFMSMVKLMKDENITREAQRNLGGILPPTELPEALKENSGKKLGGISPIGVKEKLGLFSRT